MTSGFRSTWLAVPVVLVLVGSHAGGQVFVERGAPPSSFRDLYAKAEMIIVGSVVGVSPFVPASTQPPLYHPMTKYSVLVTDVIKPGRDVAVGATVDVVQIGTGNRDTEPGLETLFKEGDEYVLAIVWRPRHEVFQLQFGAEGVFQLRDGLVWPRGISALSVKHRQSSGKAFIDRLRAPGR
jgi:hypothetical protein